MDVSGFKVFAAIVNASRIPRPKLPQQTMALIYYLTQIQFDNGAIGLL